MSLSGNAERARRQRRSPASHVVARDLRRGAGVDRLPAGEAPMPCEIAAVSPGHHDVLDPAAEVVGDDLGERRARALALRGGAGRDRDLAVRHDADGDALERAEARALDVIADADAEIAALGAGLGLPRAEAVVARQLDGAAAGSSGSRRCRRPAACRRGKSGPANRASARAG